MAIATVPITCGGCGRGVGAEIVMAEGYNTATVQQVGFAPRPNATLWLRCPSCFEGSVRTTTGAVYPAAPAGRSVGGLPPDIEKAWQEGRVAHNVAAYTAAEMMFRKILMHVAVDKAGASSGATFAHYIDALDTAGYITTGMRVVVDQVRQRGNAANHDLPASTAQESLATMTITEHLLEAMYELPGLATPAP